MSGKRGRYDTGVGRGAILSADKVHYPADRNRQPAPRPAGYENPDVPSAGVEAPQHVMTHGHFTPGCFVTPPRNGRWSY